MSLKALKDIRKVYASLNADEVRQNAAREVRIGLIADSEETLRDMEDFLAPVSLGARSRSEALRMVHRLDKPRKDFDILLCEPGVGIPRNGYLFEPEGDDKELIAAVVAENADIELPLARAFPPFRSAVAHQIISRVSKENAMLALMTALPNVIPSFIELPWAVGEFATDTAFLTMNQIRMALMIAAIHDLPVGYVEQKGAIATIAAGAFGWRAIARELVSHIPLGGGLIPKAAIAYAGTWVAGQGLERLYRTGTGHSREERREAWARALDRGREVAGELRG